MMTVIFLKDSFASKCEKIEKKNKDVKRTNFFLRKKRRNKQK